MNDDNEYFDVSFAGEMLPGHPEDAVRNALQQRFRLDAAGLERLFSGRRQFVKRACDRETALKYQRAFKEAGARPIITRAAGAGPAQKETTATPAPAPVLSLAEPGSDVLRPEERAVITPVDIDTEHLQLGEPGAALSEAAPQPERRPAPDLELAEAGARLAPAPADATQTAPNTGAIELVPGELDLSDCAPAAPSAPVPVPEHLQLSPVGSALLPEDERSQEHSTVPDTAHLRVLAQDDPGQ